MVEEQAFGKRVKMADENLPLEKEQPPQKRIKTSPNNNNSNSVSTDLTVLPTA